MAKFWISRAVLPGSAAYWPWPRPGSGDCPVYYHNMALASCLSSSWRLEGSGPAMADVFAKRFWELGWTIQTDAEIGKILVEDRVVKGVELTGGGRSGLISPLETFIHRWC